MNIPCLNCTGCLACYNICPMKAIAVNNDDEGFYVPSVDNDICIQCGKCEKVCPILTPLDNANAPINAYAAWAKDSIIVRNSSSGGLFSIIANLFLDGGSIYAAAFEKDWTVKHICATSKDDVKRQRGSKYLQSYIGEAYSEIKSDLTRGKRVLFVGTPCQVSGLNSYLHLTKTKTSYLITIDLACHGVPTPMIFKDYICYIEKKYGKAVKSFSFREKKWSWMRYNTRAVFSTISSYRGKWEEDVYMRGFLREYFLRNSCHSCKYACSLRQGDITLSDYWNYNPRDGEIKNNDNGVSVVLVNNSKGQKIIEAIKEKLIIYERTKEDALSSSQPYSKPFSASPQRRKFWQDYKENGFEYLIDRYFQPEIILPRYAHVYKYGRLLDPFATFIHDKMGEYINILKAIKKKL